MYHPVSLPVFRNHVDPDAGKPNGYVSQSRAQPGEFLHVRAFSLDCVKPEGVENALACISIACAAWILANRVRPRRSRCRSLA